MRVQSTSDGLENKPDSPATVNRDPSYPDRERIDSDVRAFLRPASSPWIVFDRDSRVDDFAKAALRLGKVFASSPCFVEDSSGDVVSSVPLDRPIPEPSPKPPTRFEPPLPPPTIDPGVGAAATKADAFANGAVLEHAMSSVLPSTGVFPPSTDAPDANVEPSNLVVASDVISNSDEQQPEDAPTSGEVALATRRRASRRWMAFVAGACAGVLALAGATVLMIGNGASAEASAASRIVPTAQAVQAAMPSPVADPPLASRELDRASATEEGAIPAKPDKPEKKPRFGKLTIKSEAKYKNVFFDGKRMLGTGQRTFLVYCGKHTIAVSDKASFKEIEIPCGGEYVVSK
jgi:hypothetical protein